MALFNISKKYNQSSSYLNIALNIAKHMVQPIPNFMLMSTDSQAVLGPLLLKSNSLHIILYFEESLCIAVTYYLEIKVTSNILD